MLLYLRYNDTVNRSLVVVYETQSHDNDEHDVVSYDDVGVLQPF